MGVIAVWVLGTTWHFVVASLVFLANQGIFSYCSKSDGGRGELHMWAIANGLRMNGIHTYVATTS